MSNNTHKRNLPVPFFSQRDNKYEWQRIAKDGGEEIKAADADPARGINAGIYQAGTPIGYPYALAWESCNITSLCMILHYFGITRDTPDDMLRKFFEEIFPEFRQEKNDFKPNPNAPSQGTDRLEDGYNLKLFAEQAYPELLGYIEHGANWNSTSLTLDGIKAEIAKGYPVWLSYGALTKNKTSGHIAVVRGFTNEEDVIINDPFGDIPSPFGLLNPDTSKIKGYVYSLDGTNEYDKYYGLGSGDNCIIKKDEFAKIIKTPNLNQTLVIRYPHYWSFPVRDGTGKLKLTTSTVPEGKTEAEYKAEQKKKMRSHVVISENGGYPIASLGAWHEGIHIKGGADTSVYPIGPARLIAARIQEPDKNDTIPSSCFVLLQHRYTKQAKPTPPSKEFFSYYLHLKPIDIQERLKQELIPCTETAVNGSHEHDWIDQIICHVQPKKAMVYVKSPANGKVDSTMPLIHILNSAGQIVPTNPEERLPDRGLIYLCPNQNLHGTLKTFLENISPEDDSEIRLSRLYNQLNDIEQYKQGNYYCIYYRKNHSSPIEVRYVPISSEIKPQRIHIKEYAHYRKKLISLMQGKVVTFTGEDTDTTKSVSATKKSPKAVCAEILNLQFPTAEFPGLIFAANESVENQFKKVKDWYLEHSDDPDKTHIDLLQRFLATARELLMYPEGEITSPFMLTVSKETWHKGMRSAYTEVFKKSIHYFPDTYITDQAEERNHLGTSFAEESWAIENEGTNGGFKTVFNKWIREVFECIKDSEVIYITNYYASSYNGIKNYYIDEIKKISSLPDIYRFVGELINKTARFIHTLTAWEPSDDKNKFSLTPPDKWYPQLKPIMKEICVAIGKKQTELRLEILEDKILHSHPVNSDYHIEVNTNTVMGKVGIGDSEMVTQTIALPAHEVTKREVHISIFSQDNMIEQISASLSDEQSYALVTDTAEGPFVNCHETVEKLRNIEFLTVQHLRWYNQNIITKDELINVLKATNLNENIIIKRPNVLGQIDDKSIKQSLPGAIGFLESNGNYDRKFYEKMAWLTEDIEKECNIDGFNLSRSGLYHYYHPIGLLNIIS